MTDQTIKIRIIENQTSNTPGKLADAELHFTNGPLAGLKLIGFSIWERRTGGGRNVTFPARSYSVNGERRSFALLRPVSDANAQEHVRELILQAYAAWENGATSTTTTSPDQDPPLSPTEPGPAPSRAAGFRTATPTGPEPQDAAGTTLGNAISAIGYRSTYTTPPAPQAARPRRF